MSKNHKKIKWAVWQRLRNAVLDAEPLCRWCASRGLTVGATDVDHIVPLAAGGKTELSNLQPLCRACHIEKTRAENRRSIAVGLDGWPIGLHTGGK